jgi:hypothetical protein
MQNDRKGTRASVAIAVAHFFPFPPLPLSQNGDNHEQTDRPLAAEGFADREYRSTSCGKQLWYTNLVHKSGKPI